MTPLLPTHNQNTDTSTAYSVVSSYVAALQELGITLSQRHITLLETFLSEIAPSELPLPTTALLGTSVPGELHVGTGLTVTQHISSAIASAQQSVLFATCFWADSESRNVLAAALRELSSRSVASNKRVTVRIGFSSSGVFQKLFHPQTERGKTYAPSTWPGLGLPSASELPGLDLEVKSIFFLPFSVLHSKFCIVDGKQLFLPSANVSWETWLEQCTTFTGPIVGTFSAFWDKIWGPSGKHPMLLQTPQGKEVVPTIFLPHLHHRYPYPLFPPPASPQNIFFLELIKTTSHRIYIHTPNLTSEPLSDALCAAIERGVNVQIVTCRRMMLLEQLVTAAITTEICVERIIKKTKGIQGKLQVWYYEGDPVVKSHVKAMIADGEITILGSANGDRASWYTSQEVNVAVFDKEFAERTRRELVQGARGGRLECVAGDGELEE
ncbi:hypothetical protein FPQ18DRAFT_313219 [Pyronema domesticum]|uniref:Similar to Probable cardiolipin synthase acc. no. P31048 n=1 Tax=Pyronema omphalodes (strain CBS 100304) TaxID=1076935 RepID=U4LFR6_PYROM|nr:hypothetical protein FPQ18DRAFT_313219 [Pyronema domesticum]CCX14297.1 Similar to Probable cardiolipin synthase; acc. no. P31048 [Pyronema omphalodes CBS 100304]